MGWAALIVVSLWVVQRLILGQPWFGFDDAYIYIHSANVLHTGVDPNYGVSGLVGISSPIFLALLAALMLVLPGPWALDVLCLLGAIGYATGIVRIANLAGCSRSVSIALSVVSLIVAQTPMQLMNGLETGLTMAAITWALALSMEPDTRRSWMLALVCGAMPFIRPDIAPIGALLMLRSIYRTGLAPGARDAALAVLAALPWAIWMFADLGTVLPNTLQAKRDFFSGPELDQVPGLRALFLRSALLRFTLEMGLFSFGWLLFIWRAERTLKLCFIVFAAIFLGAYFVTIPNVLVSYFLRYLYPLAPFAIAGAAMALGPRSIIGTRQGGAFVAACVGALITFPAFWANYLNDRENATIHLVKMAQWVNDNIPPTETILIHDAGYIAYGTKNKLVDLVGLKTPWAAELVHEHGRPRGIGEIAAKANARYLIASARWEYGWGILPAIDRAGWSIERLTDPREHRFRVYKITRTIAGES